MGIKPEVLVIGRVTTQRMFEAMLGVCEIHELLMLEDQQTWLAENGGRVKAVVTDGHWGVQPDIIKHLHNLEMISCYGVGYDNIDAVACAKRGIMVTHTPDVLNAEVANTAILLWLATSRRLIRDDRYVRDGKWPDAPAELTHSVENRKVGILGLGRIGLELAQRLEVFSPEISYHTRRELPEQPYQYFANLGEMAQNVDTLFCIVPGGTATHHLIDRDVIHALGPDGTLINVGRGSVVDEVAMVDALVKGELGSAGLDVFEHEPQVPAALFEMDNVTLMPHVGSGTVETRQAMGDLTVQNLLLFLAGEKVATPVSECETLVV